MRAYIEMIQRQDQPAMQHMGYGTTEGGGFVLGGQLCRRDAHGCVAFAPASLDRTAASMAHLLKPAGTLDNWKRAANLYARPGEEPMAFVVLTGFAAPLLHFTDTSGLLVHLCGESGTGKSTVMATTAAIWGNPKALVQHAPTSKYGSTHNALMAELGVLHNLPLMFDELPLTRPEGVFRLLHALVSGYERNRMSPSLDLKPGRTWQSVYLSAARCPLRTLAAGFSDGEHAAVFERTIEIALPRIDPRDRRWIAERAAAELALTNYGHAGQVFTQWLVANYDRLPKLIDTKREELMLRVGARRDEWCLFSGFAAVLVAAEMAKAAGLHDIDVEALGQWVIDTLLPAQRQGGGASRREPGGLLGEFLKENMANTVVARQRRAIRPGPDESVRGLPPGGRPYVRYIKNYGEADISERVFRDWCRRKQVDYRQAVADMKRRGQLIREHCRCALARGLACSGMEGQEKVRCLRVCVSASMVGLDDDDGENRNGSSHRRSPARPGW